MGVKPEKSENAPNRYITVAYKLYTIEDERELIEEAKKEHPFQFISGMGTTLEAFEDEITGLQKGDKFDFTIPYDKAYGEYNEEHVIDLPKTVFEINGKFDAEMVKEGNVLPLMDADGRRLNGAVVEVKDDVVTMDMNHPLAGEDLNFVGEVVENREATNAEIQSAIDMLTGSGCGCSCDSCGSGCDDNQECGGGCG